MGEQIPLLHEEAAAGGKEGDPPRIRALRHQNLVSLQRRVPRIVHDAHRPLHRSRTAAQPAHLRRIALGTLIARIRLNEIGGMHRASCAESIGRGGKLLAVALKLLTPGLHEGLQIGRRRGALHDAQHLVHLQIEHVAWVVEQVLRVQPTPHLYEDPAAHAEDAGALEPEVFTIRHAPPGMLQHPPRDPPSQRMAAQGVLEPLLRPAPVPQASDHGGGASPLLAVRLHARPLALRRSDLPSDLEDETAEEARAEKPGKCFRQTSAHRGPVARRGQERNPGHDDHVREHVQHRMTVEPVGNKELDAHEPEVHPGAEQNENHRRVHPQRQGELKNARSHPRNPEFPQAHQSSGNRPLRAVLTIFLDVLKLVSHPQQEEEQEREPKRGEGGPNARKVCLPPKQCRVVEGRQAENGDEQAVSEGGKRSWR